MQQAVHLFPAPAIFADFPDDPLLGFRQGKGQVLAVKTVEIVPHGLERMPLEISLALVFQLEDVELDVKQFLEFETVLCLAEQFGRLGEMDVGQGVAQVHQFPLLDEPGRQGFRNVPVCLLENGCLYFADGFAVEVGFLHLLRGRVNGLEAH